VCALLLLLLLPADMVGSRRVGSAGYMGGVVVVGARAWRQSRESHNAATQQIEIFTSLVPQTLARTCKVPRTSLIKAPVQEQDMTVRELLVLVYHAAPEPERCGSSEGAA